MLAKKPWAPLGIWIYALSFTTFASKLALTESEESQTPDSKKPAQGGLSVVTWRSVFQVTEYGAADGTRTRDPRRDRPVF